MSNGSELAALMGALGIQLAKMQQDIESLQSDLQDIEERLSELEPK